MRSANRVEQRAANTGIFATALAIFGVLFAVEVGAAPAFATNDMTRNLSGICPDTGTDGPVWDFEAFGEDLIAAGNFTVAGNHAAKHIARWDGTAWSPLGAGMNDDVYTLETFQGDLIAAGWFTQADDLPAARVARWNGASWQSLGSGLDGPVRALTVYQGDLIVGGDFSTAGGQTAAQIARWNGSSWSPMGTGFSNGVPSGFGVRALAVHDGVLVAGGFFTRADGNAAPYIAQWTGASWIPLGVWTHGGVYSLLSTTSGLVAGSVVWHSGEGDWEDMIASWNGTSWEAVGTGALPPPFSAGIRALGTYGGDLIAAGRFSQAGGVTAANIARWDGVSWHPLGSGMNTNAVIDAVEEFKGELVAGGEFTTAGGQPIPSLAQWDGLAWGCLTAFPLPPVTLDVPSNVDPDSAFDVAIRVGNVERPVSDLFGISGKLVVSDPGVLQILNIRCEDSEGQPLDLGADVLCFGNIDQDQGVVGWGVTRKAGAGGVSGTLEVVRIGMRFGPHAAGGRVCVDLTQSSVHGIDPQGLQLPLAVVGTPSPVCASRACAVWPGDANNDGVVDEQDVIALGLSWGAHGDARVVQGCSWQENVVACWNPPDATYADAYGDGQVDEQDVLCIGVNWGRNHALPPGSQPVALPGDFDPAQWRAAFEAMHALVHNQGRASAGMQAVEDALEHLLSGGAPPRVTALYQNQPNPFNPQTTIRFDLAHDGRVSLRIYDVAGRLVRILFDEERQAGRDTVVWNGLDDAGAPVGSGLYLVRLATGESLFTRKMLLMK